MNRSTEEITLGESSSGVRSRFRLKHHLHYWSVQMTRAAKADEVLEAFAASSRVALIGGGDGLTALNTIKELMADLSRPHDNLYEVALWADMLTVRGDELFVRTWWTIRPSSSLKPSMPSGPSRRSRRTALTPIARTNAELGISALQWSA